MTEPTILEIEDRKLIGMRIQTSLSENRTFELWRQFKPRVKEINGRKNGTFYSVQNFPHGLDFKAFTNDTIFEKWAAVEVENFDALPMGMEPLLLPGGEYAVFVHSGPASTGYQTFEFIFGTWLPNSAFERDNRPHFELMTADYLPTDPNAQEEFWIPIKRKI